jgi:hypothetical protein
MAPKAALFLLPLFALAQTSPAPPPEVDQELRARATQFMQYHVVNAAQGSLRKAMDMVAEDTKDDYLREGKMELKSFTLGSIKYTDNFTKAVVNFTVRRDWQIPMAAKPTEVAGPMATNWKIEDGKWMWYRDRTNVWLTPMGPSNLEALQRASDPTNSLPKNLTPDAVAAAAANILGRANIDKAAVTLNSDRRSTDKVVFSNGAPGTVLVSLEGVPNIPGFRAELEQKEAGGGEKVNLVLSYEPPANAVPPEPFTIHLVTEPFNQTFGIKVTIGKPASK